MKKMTCKELEKLVIANRCKMSTATPEEKRRLIAENHEAMVEMDRRWNEADRCRKAAR